MLDAPEDMAGLSRNEGTREVARGNLVGVTGMASVGRRRGNSHGHNWTSVNMRGGHERERP